MYNARTKPKYLNTMEPVFSVFDYLWWISVLWLLCVIRFEYDCQIMEVEVVHLGSSLSSPSSLTLCLSSCPALSWQYKQRFKFIEFTINYPCLAQIIFYMCRFVYSGMFTFTFAFGKSTEFLVGNLKWLPIILTHLARSSTDFSALF